MRQGFSHLQTLKASKECQKECADDCTALLESLAVCKRCGLNLALTQRAYLNTFGRVRLFFFFFFLRGGGKWLCYLFTNRKWVRKARFWMHMLNWFLCRDCRKLARQINFWCMPENADRGRLACTQKVLSARSQSVAGRLMLALADERFLERNCPSFLSRSFSAWLQFCIILVRHWARRICCLCKCWWTEFGSIFPPFFVVDDEMRLLGDSWAE